MDDAVRLGIPAYAAAAGVAASVAWVAGHPNCRWAGVVVRVGSCVLAAVGPGWPDLAGAVGGDLVGRAEWRLQVVIAVLPFHILAVTVMCQEAVRPRPARFVGLDRPAGFATLPQYLGEPEPGCEADGDATGGGVG